MHWTGRITGNENKIAFELFGNEVAWYGIIVTSAMLLGLILACVRSKRYGLTTDDCLEVFLLLVPFSLLFGRLGHVFAVQPELLNVKSFSDFVQIFAVWKGGITIVTGLLGGVVSALVWAKWRKKDFLLIADCALPTVLCAQALGRWGNFINQEIFGQAITNANAQWFPLAVYINDPRAGVAEGFYQATFFYEAVLNLALMFAILFVLRRLRLKGAGTLLYFTAYPLVRFIMEFFRNENIYNKVNYTQISMGLVALACAGLFTFLVVRAVKKGEKIWFKKGIPEELWLGANVDKAKPSKPKDNNEKINEEPINKENPEE